MRSQGEMFPGYEVFQHFGILIRNELSLLGIL